MDLLKITMVETPPFLDQVIKPFNTDLKAGMVFDAEHNYRGSTSANALSRFATSLVAPTGKWFKSNIAGGWGDNKLRFAGLVCMDDRRHSKEYMYVCGFTDHADYSVKSDGTVRFSPTMKLYFNSVTAVDVQEMEHRGASVWQPKLSTHDQILSKSVFNRETVKDTALLRPSDLFRRRGEKEASGFQREFPNSVLTTGKFTSEMVSNNRLNNAPSTYLSRAAGAYIRSAQNQVDLSGSGYDDQTEGEILDDAIDRVDENLIDANPFFDELRNVSNIMRTGYITWGELMDMNPDFDEDRQVGIKRLPDKRDNRDFGATLKGDDPESIAANILVHSLPLIMLYAQYSSIEGMVIDTRARHGEAKVILPYIAPYMPGIDVSATYDYFVDQMEDYVIPDMTKSGMFDVYAKVNASIDGDIEVWISVDGGKEMYVPFPQWGDGLCAPTLTDDLTHLVNVSADILKISSEILKVKNRSNKTHLDTPPDFSKDQQQQSTTRAPRRGERSW